MENSFHIIRICVCTICDKTNKEKHTWCNVAATMKKLNSCQNSRAKKPTTDELSECLFTPLTNVYAKSSIGILLFVRWRSYLCNINNSDELLRNYAVTIYICFYVWFVCLYCVWMFVFLLLPQRICFNDKTERKHEISFHYIDERCNRTQTYQRKLCAEQATCRWKRFYFMK